jgi:SNF2 family DNA or RNA helicase
MQSLIQQKIMEIQQDSSVSDLVIRRANKLYQNGQCQMLTHGQYQFRFSIDDEFKDYTLTITFSNNAISTKCNCNARSHNCQHAIVGLLELKDFCKRHIAPISPQGKQYTREGMIQRVLLERKEKALREKYRIQFADNIYGEHEVVNEKGRCYYVTFRDIEKQQGYCCCPDFQTNKLGICKHLMAAFMAARKMPEFISKSNDYPFVEIYLDPLNNYQISWYYPDSMTPEVKSLLNTYFGDSHALPHEKTGNMLNFIELAQVHKNINIRPEVHTAVESFFEDRMIHRIAKNANLDFSVLSCELFDYQKEGIFFATMRKSAIIADEMGLGKTVQAIGTAIFKKELFGFERTLVICPASLKDQWKREIERFSDEKATIIEGSPEKRQHVYENELDYFLITNYETVLRDLAILQKESPDFIILDEAQRIKNYETLTANTVKQIPKKHGLIITGTPIENRLIDLYSIMDFLDPKILSPLWEFSYQHCYFDMVKRNKINGYYNLQKLKERLKPVLIRREKHDVLKQLPKVRHIDIPVPMHQRQAELHSSYARGVARIIHKKFMTPFDMQRLMVLLGKMRMVCDSTHLVEIGEPCSPKLDELKQVLLDKLDLEHSKHKVVIFSEWIRMNQMIGRLLRDNNIGYVELNGKVPVANRPKLIQEFEDNPECKIFVSTEAGGTGLNLQTADAVINFELPWNPAKKNQRIGRIDRLGQKNKHLTVISFITQNSIETRIASGLLLKQDLFDSVLSPDSALDEVDFSSKNRSQFLKDLENAIQGFTEITDENDFSGDSPDIQHDTSMNEMDDNDETILTEQADDEIETNEQPDVIESENDVKAEVNTQPPDESTPSAPAQTEQLESVLNQGVNFLSGLMQMATGKSMELSDKAIEVNRETGEVVMRFKLPV